MTTKSIEACVSEMSGPDWGLPWGMVVMSLGPALRLTP